MIFYFTAVYRAKKMLEGMLNDKHLEKAGDVLKQKFSDSDVSNSLITFIFSSFR